MPPLLKVVLLVLFIGGFCALASWLANWAIRPPRRKPRCPRCGHRADRHAHTRAGSGCGKRRCGCTSPAVKAGEALPARVPGRPIDGAPLDSYEREWFALIEDPFPSPRWLPVEGAGQ
jgi:hypothetical protein